jgi:CubicO group peptidase (beta-lactamase class C family)
MGRIVGNMPLPGTMIQAADENFFRFPQTRWSFSNLQKFRPTRVVSRGAAIAREMPRAERTDIDAVRFQPIGGTGPMTWAQSLLANYTDGILVLHCGRIVYERYFGALTSEGQHIAFSVTKSFAATIAATLLSEGVLNERATVASYVPELKDCGFADAMIRELLDMTTGIGYTENYPDELSPCWDFCRANDFLPPPEGYSGPETAHAYLQSLGKGYPHGERFCTKPFAAKLTVGSISPP